MSGPMVRILSCIVLLAWLALAGGCTEDVRLATLPNLGGEPEPAPMVDASQPDPEDCEFEDDTHCETANDASPVDGAEDNEDNEGNDDNGNDGSGNDGGSNDGDDGNGDCPEPPCVGAVEPGDDGNGDCPEPPCVGAVEPGV